MSILKNYHNLTGPSEVIVDDTHYGNITLVPATGGWTKVSGTNSGYSDSFLHDGGAGKGSRSATFSPNVVFSGNYAVSIRWKQANNRATDVPVTVTHAGGTTTTLPKLDQTGSGDTWVPLGTYFFNAGTTGNVKITNTGTTSGKLVVADAVKLTPTASLPAGWSSADVGTVGVPGSATHSGGVYTVKGSGGTLGGTTDAFHFAGVTKSGDCTITARVVSQTFSSQYARAGVMIRDANGGASAMFADAILTPTNPSTGTSNGTYLQSRLTTGGTAATTSTGAGAAPYWVRVTRVGNVFTAYKSATGATGSWVPMSTSKTITGMPSSVKVGLAVCSYANTTLGTAVFDNVTITP
jgi:regulation of enolase protein 1 (concanavalin A-like superfamily)